MSQRSFNKRPQAFQDISRKTWENPSWQQHMSARQTTDLVHHSPALSPARREQADRWMLSGLRFALTPYMLSLVEYDSRGEPVPNDPIWRQFAPQALPGAGVRPGQDEYTALAENWETPEEMITPICQHKYDNRAIIYVNDSCLAYCTFCFRALQSTDPHEKHGGLPHWSETLAAIAARPQIEEVIVSGGDPLVLKNERLFAILSDLRKIPTVRALRIHTRAWTHNPFRLDAHFAQAMHWYNVTSVSIHVAHPAELTIEFEEALERLRTKSPRTQFLPQIPLIKGVNDSVEVLRELFMGLWQMGVRPYYLLHLMPNIPAARIQRTSVQRGVELMLALKRRISNPAMPEYIIVHNTGKHTVPLELYGTNEFQYGHRLDGHPAIRFKNWKGDLVKYLDGVDEVAAF